MSPRFALSFTGVGLIVGVFGIGGLIYAGSVQQFVNRFGQPGLAIFGGIVLGLAYVTLAAGLAWSLKSNDPIATQRGGGKPISANLRCVTLLVTST